MIDMNPVNLHNHGMNDINANNCERNIERMHESDVHFNHFVGNKTGDLLLWSKSDFKMFRVIKVDKE